ncbi:MAG: transglutaminase domain-containing protein [Proteobacteria bacterium]|nr:transglutaminase domain-containing protein [Pseudomonadota bacterium]
MRRQVPLRAVLCSILAMIGSCKSRLASDTSLKGTSAFSGANYTISATIELITPIDLSAMNTPWQSATLVSQTPVSAIYDVTINPFMDFKSTLKSNPNWQRDNKANPALASYLKPGVTTNWDLEMQTQLLTALKTEGINPSTLTDVELVQQVSNWVFKPKGAFQYKTLFIPYYLSFEAGKIAVQTELKEAFSREKLVAGITSDEDTIQLGMLGKSMFEARIHGDCTASATLLATILKALGIPTRLVVNIPLVDANDPNQIQMVNREIRHPTAKKSSLAFSRKVIGSWATHTFNEVFIGSQWVRLNYTRLGQEIVDPDSLGIMIQVAQMKDWSESQLGNWGIHAAKHKLAPLFSVNPYRTIKISDQTYHGFTFPPDDDSFGELKIAKIDKALKADDAALPDFLRVPFSKSKNYFLNVSNQDGNLQKKGYLKQFLKSVSNKVSLKSPGHPTVSAMIVGTANDGKNIAGFVLQVLNPETLVLGASYKLEAETSTGPYHYEIGADVRLSP